MQNSNKALQLWHTPVKILHLFEGSEPLCHSVNYTLVSRSADVNLEELVSGHQGGRCPCLQWCNRWEVARAPGYNPPTHTHADNPN